MTEKNKDISLTGFQVLNSASLNKGTAFTEEERRKYKLRGLLPPAVCPPEIQMQRTLENLRRIPDDIGKYVFLTALQARNERLFYKVLINHIEEVMPLIYTPTVGLACKLYAHLFRRTRGIYVACSDRGEVREVLDNWPYKNIRVIEDIVDGLENAPRALIGLLHGENRGKRLVYSNVVTSWQVVRTWNGRRPLSLNLKTPGDEPVVIVLQYPGPGQVVASARLR